MDPAGNAAEEKRSRIYLSGRRGGKELFFRRLADEAVKRGESVGHFARNPITGKCELRPYVPASAPPAQKAGG